VRAGVVSPDGGRAVASLREAEAVGHVGPEGLRTAEGEHEPDEYGYQRQPCRHRLPTCTHVRSFSKKPHSAFLSESTPSGVCFVPLCPSWSRRSRSPLRRLYARLRGVSSLPPRGPE